MVKRISKFDFTGIEVPIEVKKFSPSFNFRASREHQVILGSCFGVLDLIIESNTISKSGLGTKIRQPYPEIFKLSHQNPKKINFFKKIPFSQNLSHKKILQTQYSTSLIYSATSRRKNPFYLI
jgi:hypothetical protein